MLILLTFFFSQFNLQYRNFVNSPESNSIFNGLTRGTYKISDFADNSVVLWFWRSSTGNPEVDSLLRGNHLRKNFHLAAVLRWEATEADDYETQLNKIYLATHFDSSAIENFLSLISLGWRHRNIEPIKAAFSLPVFADFRSQLFMITNSGILLLAAIFMCSLTFILVKMVYYLPALSHRILPIKHAQIIDIIKSLILLIPVLIFRNLYLLFVCYSFLLIFVLTSQEKNWLRFNIIALLLIFILSLPINNFISFLKENNINYQLYEIVTYDSFNSLEPDKIKDKEFLAYGLKQQNKLEEALSLYEELYYGGNRNVAVVNNLANIYFLYEETTRAESLYNFAIISQDRGEPFFNLGLLKLKNIEYLESSKYMEEARKRNFSSLLTVPVDIKPTNSDFYKTIFAEKLKFNSIVKTVYILPILIILILSFLPFKMSSPFFCTSCGRPICKDCLKDIEEETICKNCFTKFKSTRNKGIEEDLMRSVNKNRKRTRTFIVCALNIIIPGAGLIYLRKHLTGIIIVGIVMMGYLPLLFSKMFIRPAGWIALPLTSIFFAIAITIAIFSYIISFSLIRGNYAN